ncbi:phage major capsid protein [Cereibacter azotoformans]|uniref:phage major capsid protein n=1 Tax=Cereibacter azotoformans TaxID=43057 RepID=UPI003B223B19
MARIISPLCVLLGAYHTRAVTPEQINANRDEGPLQRFGEVRQIDKEARTVELAFSSETPVERWFGEEILDHGGNAMRMGRIEGGAPLLINHDWEDQIGVVERVWIGDDRRGRAKVRFGKSARAEEIWTDVVDGIRKHVSVGYRVHKVEVTTRKGAADLIHVIDWEPYEISIVAVPADPTVGVGRSLDGDGERGGGPENQPKGNEMKHRTYRDAQGNLVRVQVGDDGQDVAGTEEILERAAQPGQERQGQADEARIRAAGSEQERARVRGLLDLGRSYNAADLADEAIRNGATAEQLQARILERMNQRNSRPVSEGQDQEVGLTDAEVRRYSIFRGLRALLPSATQREREAAAFEIECTTAAERTYGRQARGLLIPQEVLSRAFNAGGAANTPAGATTGQNLVGTTFMAGSFIDMLRNRTVLLQLARSMMGLVGNVEVPKQTGGATAYWIGEGADATEGVPTIGQIGLTPKTVAAYTDITRRLMQQGTPDAELIVRDDLNRALALAIDLAGFYGTGADNQPKGIVNYAGINAVDFGTDGGGAGTGQMPTYAEIVQMESEIAADNADVSSMAYVLNARMRGHMKTTPKFASGTDAGTIWEQAGTVNGYRADVTNQIANGDVFFGNFADLIVGMWGGLDVTIDPYSLSKSGGLRIVMFQDVDFVLRRVESFCLGRDSTA